VAESEKKKRIEVLEKKYQDVLDLNGKEYDEAQLLLAQSEAQPVPHVLVPLSGLVAPV
jgi:hypothetical protein